MKRIVINACGLKSKGGITVFKKLIENNTDVKFYIVYDNFELKQLVGNNESIFIRTPRYLQPFLNYFIKRDDLKFINNFDEIIHLGNFGFKTQNDTRFIKGPYYVRINSFEKNDYHLKVCSSILTFQSGSLCTSRRLRKTCQS